jgi:hypothetical protein
MNVPFQRNAEDIGEQSNVRCVSWPSSGGKAGLEDPRLIKGPHPVKQVTRLIVKAMR